MCPFWRVRGVGVRERARRHVAHAFLARRLIASVHAPARSQTPQEHTNKGVALCHG